jgi:hypothetical protein
MIDVTCFRWFFCAGLVWILAAGALPAQETEVWRIGNFDHASAAPASINLDRQLSYHAGGRHDSPIDSDARVRIPVSVSALRITAVDDRQC